MWRLHAVNPAICANSVAAEKWLEPQPILQSLHIIRFGNLPDKFAPDSLYLEVLWS